MNPKPLVEVKDISMRYHSPQGEVNALKNISLDIYKGEFISIVGPSGCGKSTLLNIMAGLITPSQGNVLIEGAKISGPTTAVGYMPQSDQLFPWRTIWQNAMLGLEIQGKKTLEAQEYVAQLLKNYGLYEFKNSYPSQLSGGMRQRAALIRTLAINPSILLLDEAFSALDYQTRLVVTDEVKQIITENKKTTVLVTHDISEAISMSDRIILLTNRPGSVKNIYTIELTCSTKTPLKCREAPEFSKHFNTIWKELDVNVK
ncbi:NitT/TauT family transport system ATP-binding protein [Desulfitispora alkaliphila]|uniref:ABC transporter ATP-binding protein n=1 Tax=Desulfitispora alkaliphila TaxID=622674 RepID=UPI003D2224A4